MRIALASFVKQVHGRKEGVRDIQKRVKSTQSTKLCIIIVSFVCIVNI